MKTIWERHDVWAGRKVIKRTISTSLPIQHRDHPFVIGYIHSDTFDGEEGQGWRCYYGLIDYSTDGMFIGVGRSLDDLPAYLTEHGYIPAETVKPQFR